MLLEEKESIDEEEEEKIHPCPPPTSKSKLLYTLDKFFDDATLKKSIISMDTL